MTPRKVIDKVIEGRNAGHGSDHALFPGRVLKPGIDAGDALLRWERQPWAIS